jgi:hypothetical protein
LLIYVRWRKEGREGWREGGRGGGSCVDEHRWILIALGKESSSIYVCWRDGGREEEREGGVMLCE